MGKTTYVTEKHLAVLSRLAKIADAFDANELDDGARKFWGANDENQNTTPPAEIEIYSGRGGRQLLTLQDCLDARDVLRSIR